MIHGPRMRLRWLSLGAGVLIAACWLWARGLPDQTAAVAFQGALQPLSEPPKDQTFIGAKQCAACHFDQFLVWRQTKHSKGFEILPAAYKTDASCLPCHSTGHGQATGFTSLTATPDLVGTSCEACHGPGSKHGEIAKGFGSKKLSAEEVAYVKSTIHKILPGNACTKCHTPQGHKKHPPYNK